MQTPFEARLLGRLLAVTSSRHLLQGPPWRHARPHTPGSGSSSRTWSPDTSLGLSLGPPSPSVPRPDPE